MKRATSTILGFVIVLAFGSNFANADFSGLPDSSQTPGAFNSAVTQSNIHKTICVSGYTATIRPPANYTTDLKISQLDSGYNVGGDTKVSDYEEDHLIPLEIGGNPTSKLNLWPELWNGAVGAHVKDKLENKIHTLICNGSMTLAAGRAIFAHNWETGYQKYVGALSITSEPAAAPPTIQAPPVASTPKSTTPDTVHAGSFCSPDGATGLSKAGVTYTCKSSPTDTRDRWRQ